jgi:hypothetical protein
MVAAVPGERVARWLARSMVLAFAVGAGLVIAGRLNAGLPVQPGQLGFDLVWLVVVSWVSYWWGFRLVLRVELRADAVLVWRSALRRGELPVEEISGIGSNALLMSNVIRHRRGRVLVFGAVVGFPELVTELKRRRPAVDGEVADWMLRVDRAQRRLLRIWPWRWLAGGDAAQR